VDASRDKNQHPEKETALFGKQAGDFLRDKVQEMN